MLIEESFRGSMTGRVYSKVKVKGKGEVDIGHDSYTLDSKVNDVLT